MMLILKNCSNKKKVLLLLATVCLFTVIACKHESSPTIDDFIGKEIVFPDSLSVIKNDTLLPQNKNFFNTGTKKVIHLFKADCGKCVDSFNQLNQYLKSLEGNFECMFFIYTSNYKYFKTHVYPQLNTAGYLILNNNNQFEKSNKLEGTYNLLNTFIINGNNEIEFIGNPINSKDNMSEFINHLILNNE